MQNNYNKFTDMLIDLNKAVTELSDDKYLNSYQQQLDAIIVDMKEFVNLNLKDINGLTPPPYDKQEIFDRVVKQLNKGNFTDITRKDLREVISWDKTYQEQSHVSLLSKCISHPERYIDQKLCYLICCVWINYYDKLEDKRNIIKLMLNGYISFIEKTCKDKKKLFDRTITIKKNIDIYFADNSIKKIVKHITDTEDKSAIVDNLSDFLMNQYGDLYLKCIYYVVEYINISEEVLLEKILMNDTYGSNILADILSKTIVKYSDKGLDHNKLEEYILEYKKNEKIVFGDPRQIKNDSNWAYVTPEAKKIFKNWRTAHDIQLFFDIIFEEKNSAVERREFWLNYADSMENVSFFINDSDIARLESKIDGASVGKLNTIRRSSIFVMGFEYFFIVVASHPGDLALRVYAKDHYISKIISEEKEIKLAILRNDQAYDLLENINIDKYKLAKLTQDIHWRSGMKNFLVNNNIHPQKDIIY